MRGIPDTKSLSRLLTLDTAMPDSFFVNRNPISTETPERAADESAMNTPASAWQGAKSVFGQATEDLAGTIRRHWHDDITADTRTPERQLHPDEANKIHDMPEGHKFTHDVSESSAQDIADSVKKRMAAENVFRRFSESHNWLTRNSVGMVASMLDPVNAATLLVPGIGEENVAYRLAQAGFGSRAAIIGGKVAAGSTGAMAGTAVGLPLKAITDHDMNYDFSVRDAMTELLYAAPFGAMMHAGLTPAVGSAARWTVGAEQHPYFHDYYHNPQVAAGPSPRDLTPDGLRAAITRGVAEGSYDPNRAPNIADPHIGYIRDMADMKQVDRHGQMSANISQLLSGREVDNTHLIPDLGEQARRLNPEAHEEYDRLKQERDALAAEHVWGAKPTPEQLNDPAWRLEQELREHVKNILPVSWDLRVAARELPAPGEVGMAHLANGKNIENIGEDDPHPTDPVIAYHATTVDKPFDKFEIPDDAHIGVHFGTREQAHPFSVVGSRGAGKGGETPRTYPVSLHMHNVVEMMHENIFDPLFALEDLNGKLPKEIYNKLENRIMNLSSERIIEGVSREDQEYALQTAHGGPAKRYAMGMEYIRDALKESGYDGIRYQNDEQPGWSYIAFKPGTVKSAYSHQPMLHLAETPAEHTASPGKPASLNDVKPDPSPAFQVTDNKGASHSINVQEASDGHGKAVEFTTDNAKVKLEQRPDGRWEVAWMTVEKAARGSGLMGKIYDAIEREYGNQMIPSGLLRESGYNFWKKRNPELVKYHQQVEGYGSDYHSPRFIKEQIAELQESLSRAKATKNASRIADIQEDMQAWRNAWNKIPAEGKSPEAIKAMYNLQETMVAGMTDPAKRTAWISAMSVDPKLVAREESGHAIRASGLFKSHEWGILRDAAINRGWIDDMPEAVRSRYEEAYAGRGADGVRDAMVEEAIMHRFAKGPEAWGEAGGPIARFMQRIQELLERVGNWMTSRGFQSANDVFRAMEEGKVSSRDTMQPHMARRAGEIDARMEELKPKLLEAYDQAKANYTPDIPTVAETQRSLWREGFAPAMDKHVLQQAIQQLYGPKEEVKFSPAKMGEVPVELQIMEQHHQKMLSEGYRLLTDEIKDLAETERGVQQALMTEAGYSQAGECLMMAGI